jgi:hypothetical protein
LIWAGGVTIRPTPQDQENYLYFKRNYAVSNSKLDGKKVSNGMAYKSSAFVENYDTSIPLLFVMEQAVTYSFAFDVKVPVDIPLPSSTEVSRRQYSYSTKSNDCLLIYFTFDLICQG